MVNIKLQFTKIILCYTVLRIAIIILQMPVIQYLQTGYCTIQPKPANFVHQHRHFRPGVIFNTEYQHFSNYRNWPDTEKRRVSNKTA